MAQRVRPNATELFRATCTVFVLTARGLGTPGVRARDAACRTNQNEAYYTKPKLWRISMSANTERNAKLQHWDVSWDQCFLFHYYCCQTFSLSIEHTVDSIFGLLFSRRFFLRVLNFASRSEMQNRKKLLASFYCTFRPILTHTWTQTRAYVSFLNQLSREAHFLLFKIGTICRPC